MGSPEKECGVWKRIERKWERDFVLWRSNWYVWIEVEKLTEVSFHERSPEKKDQVMNAKRNQGLTLYPWNRDSRLNENTCIYNWYPRGYPTLCRVWMWHVLSATPWGQCRWAPAHLVRVQGIEEIRSDLPAVTMIRLVDASQQRRVHNALLWTRFTN